VCKLANGTLKKGIHPSRTHVADTPGNGALFTGRGCLVGLAVDAQVHNVVTADGAVVDDDVPSPEGDCIPL
jgi:hypothetical protein